MSTRGCGGLTARCGRAPLRGASTGEREPRPPGSAAGRSHTRTAGDRRARFRVGPLMSGVASRTGGALRRCPAVTSRTAARTTGVSRSSTSTASGGTRMNADQHPVLAADHNDLPTLTLVLPSGLGTSQILEGLARAIGEVYADLAARDRQFQQLEDEYAERGNQFGKALCRGQALGCQRAVTAIGEAIIEAFDLWDQYPSQAPCAADGDAADLAPPEPPQPPAAVSTPPWFPPAAGRACGQPRAGGRRTGAEGWQAGCAWRRGRDGS
jgi:hypothetical protein